jgi:hypothetical protein
MDPIITETVLRSLCASDFTQEDILRGSRDGDVGQTGAPTRHRLPFASRKTGSLPSRRFSA